MQLGIRHRVRWRIFKFDDILLMFYNKYADRLTYTTFELEMLTAYMACVKGFNDLKNNNIEESLMCT